MDERGALDVLRNGVKDRGVRINLAYFRTDRGPKDPFFVRRTLARAWLDLLKRFLHVADAKSAPADR